MHKHLAQIIAAIGLVWTNAAGAPTEDAARERGIASILAEHLPGAPITGATAAIILPDGTMETGVWGTLAEDPETPMPAEARMLAGSTGKTFFSVVLLQLIEEGTLSLDDPLSKHLGGLDWFDEIPNADAITLRHLANHTSGLPDHVWFESFQRAIRENPQRAWGHAELARQIAGTDALFAPGDDWAYADSNYVLLGLAMQRATGRDCYDMIRERVLAPLELRGTSPSDRAELPGLVGGTTTLGGTFEIDPITARGGVYAINPQWEWAGGGMVSTSADLATLFHAIWTSDLLEPASIKELKNYAPARLAPGSGYSVGMIRLPTPAGACHGHMGIMPGYLTHAAHYPEHGVTVAIQVNADGPAAQQRQLAAAHALAQEAIERAAIADPASP
ncbi:MAG: serine hydrolase domain-containing protein [Phycisphaerales bacterium]